VFCKGKTSEVELCSGIIYQVILFHHSMTNTIMHYRQ